MKHSWTNEEKRVVLDHLGRFISSGVVPGKGPCEECIKRSQGALSSRLWTAVKFFVKNELERRKRRKWRKNNQLTLQPNKQLCKNFILLRSDKMESKPK